MVTHLAGKPQTPTAQGSRQITQCNKAQDLYAIYRIDVRYWPLEGILYLSRRCFFGRFHMLEGTQQCQIIGNL
jgi:hypothetical protein